jgi:hypothetical protein
MKIVKTIAIAFVAYVLLVVAFEAYLGIVQPRFGQDEVEGMNATIVITTTGADGATEDRVVVPMTTDGQLYVSSNHWPRSWYKRALANPDVQVTQDGETKDYRAVPVAEPGDEYDRLQSEHPHPAWFRFMTGYPPRKFLRLEER